LIPPGVRTSIFILFLSSRNPLFIKSEFSRVWRQSISKRYMARLQSQSFIHQVRILSDSFESVCVF